MKINKPKFWGKKDSLISIFLYPLSLIFQLALFLKKNLLRYMILKFLLYVLVIFILVVPEKHLHLYS